VKKEKEPGSLFFFFFAFLIVTLLINRGLRAFLPDYWHDLAYVRWICSNVPVWFVYIAIVITGLSYGIIVIWNPQSFKCQAGLLTIGALALSFIVLRLNYDDPFLEPLQPVLGILFALFVIGFLYRKYFRESSEDNGIK
jgi:hypothetical protein